MNSANNKKTVVIGASPNPERYGYIATERLVQHGIETIPIGIKKGQVGELTIINTRPIVSGVDTVTLYLNPKNQEDWYSYIISLKPRRIIFNPGTENPQFEEMANNAGIETTEACTLVLLSTGQF
jgi:predicted CoA-binding protein